MKNFYCLNAGTILKAVGKGLLIVALLMMVGSCQTTPTESRKSNQIPDPGKTSLSKDVHFPQLSGQSGCVSSQTASYNGPQDHTPPCNGYEPGGGLKCWAYAPAKAFELTGQYSACNPECLGQADRIANSIYFEQIPVANNSDFFNKVCYGDVVQLNQGMHYVVVLRDGQTFGSIKITDANRYGDGKVRTYMDRYCLEWEGKDCLEWVESEVKPLACGYEYLSIHESLQDAVNIHGYPTKIYRRKDISTPPPSPPAAPVISGVYYQSHPKIYWNAVSGATGYKIYKRIDEYPGDPNGSYNLFTTISGTSLVDYGETQWVGSGPKWKAWYKVKAYNASGDSDYSNYQGFTIQILF